jgi:aspartyl-tRNA(Asn)/glutamyl-tRNA(Gln) amidotransferase subunit A
MELKNLTISKVHQGLNKKEFSCLELTESYLERINQENDRIFAFLNTTPELARDKAGHIDQKIADGEKLNILSGVPCAIKDNILVKNQEVTAASKILKNYIAPYDAHVVEKLDEVGAVVLGKTNLDEFGMGSSCENSAFGSTKNPHDLKRVPGGSSGGSAAAVADSLCVFALGSDTGGSVRHPASFCGVVGLKPTYGRVSRYGLISFTSSTDTIGCLAKNVSDAALVFEEIAKNDIRDSTCTKNPPLKYSKELEKNIKGLKVGLPKEYFAKGLDEEVKREVMKAVKKLEDLGVSVVEISLPRTEYSLAAYYIINPSEASANLARYDGIKYGFSAVKDKEAKDLYDVYLKSRGKGLGPETKRRIILGTFALSSGYYEAYYKKAQKVRTLIKNDFQEAFKKVDILVSPTTPTPAFKLGEIEDPLSMYLTDVYLAGVSLAGLPALSMPCGKVNNLPVGLQIIGNYFREDLILRLAHHIEKSLNFK